LRPLSAFALSSSPPLPLSPSPPLPSPPPYHAVRLPAARDEQVHYYSNVGDRLPVLGDEERETRQTFQELVQLGHTCVVMLRRAIWSVDPTVFNPQYNLQVRLDSIHTALSQLAAQTGVYLTNPPVVQVDESVFDEVPLCVCCAVQ